MELISWLNKKETEKNITYSKIRSAFVQLPVEKQEAMMDGRRSDPMKTFDFLIKKRNSSFGSLSDMVRKFGSLSQGEEDTIDKEDRNFPIISE